MAKRTLVMEKRENAGTAAKAGLFWALLAAIPFLARSARRHHQRGQRRSLLRRFRRK